MRAPGRGALRIALVSEGTYPYAVGGVSTWCDQMIRGIPEHRWTMVPLTVDGTERPVWSAPDNLGPLEPIPLWSHAPAVPRRSERRVDAGFAAVYDGFLTAMLTPADTGSDRATVMRSQFLLALRGMYEYASNGGDLASALTSNAALAQLVAAWRAADPLGARPELTLSDALTAADLFGHLLRPLTVPPVRCDIAHATMNGLSMLVGMAAKWCYGTPLVMSEQGIYLRERYLAALDEPASRAVRVLSLGFHRALAGAGYLIADALAPHSSYNRRWQLRNGADPDRMWTMYNGVEPADFPVAEAEPDRPTVVFLGRVNPLKDLHTLIRSFTHVRTRVPGARLRIFGVTPPADAAYGASCQRLIHDLGLTGAATMEGAVESAVTAYHAATIVALTSVSEGFPHSVVEAMACGRPMVCTNVGGVAEAVADAGLVVPPRDPVAIGQACVTLLRDRELRRRMAVAARTRVMELFTLGSSLDAYRAIYDHLTTSNSTVDTAEPVRLIPQQPSPAGTSVMPRPAGRALSPVRVDRTARERRPRALGRAHLRAGEVR